MIIVIDGYNLLRQVFHKEKGKLDKQRKQLIQQLGFYKEKKTDGIKEIIVVFDGGIVGRATREIHRGIVVVFSGQRKSADDWIVEYVDRHAHSEILLITLDRELIKQAQRKNEGLDVVSGFDFYTILQNTLLEEVAQDIIKKDPQGGVKKYKRDKEEKKEVIDSEALDLLMEQASTDMYEKDDNFFDVGLKKKGNTRKPSKKEKKRIAKIKKL